MSQLLITDELDAVAEHSTTEVPSVLNRSKMIFSGVVEISMQHIYITDYQ